MTRAEAENGARALQTEHPDRDTHRFIAREVQGDDWEVVKVEVPAQLRRGPLRETVDAKPIPSPADDPRTLNEKNVPGLPGGI